MHNVLPSGVSREFTAQDLKYLSYKDKIRGRTEIEYAAIRGGQLRPWMKRLAEWSATQPGKITRKQYKEMCSQFAGVPIAQHMSNVLVFRDDWLAYREEMVADTVGLARIKLQDRVGEYMETHYQAMKSASSKVSDDPMTAAKITEPVLDRVWPKKEERDNAPTTIVLNLGAQQKVQEILEYEVLPCEIVESLPKPA